MRRKASLFSMGSLVVAALLFVPGVAGASSGSIAGGTFTDSGGMGHVDNLSVTLDDCGCLEQSAYTKLAYVDYGCPLGDLAVNRLSGFWGAPSIPTTGGTVQSGPQDFPLDGATLVCLYADSNYGFFNSTDLLASKPLVFTPAGGGAAVKKCKKKFPKGHRRAKCIKKAKKLST